MTDPVVRVLLVRHGQSTWNAEGRVQGQTHDVPLTEVGVAQARDVADRLASMGVRRVYTSDLLRAVQTADHVARATGVVARPDRRLRERSYGLLEGRPGREVPMLGRRDGDVPPGGESFADVVRRVGELLDECLADGVRDGVDCVAMVTHGDTIAAAISWLGLDPDHGPSSPGNASVTVARVQVRTAQRLSR
jgi:broad specificity phosphatase PhoE